MKQLGPVIENILRRHNLWRGYQQYLVVEKWPQIVGSDLSEVTRADYVANGLLRVIVKDSVWAYHLSMMKPRLIEKLNHYAGSGVVKDIFFQIGDLEKQEKQQS